MAYNQRSVTPLRSDDSSKTNNRIGYVNFNIPYNKGGETTTPKLCNATLEAGNPLHEILLERYREGGQEFVDAFVKNLKVTFYDIEVEGKKEAGLAF